jgi:hypothetical protein
MMSATGFLSFFVIFDTLDGAFESLK